MKALYEKRAFVGVSVYVSVCACALKWTYQYVIFAEQQQLLPQVRVTKYWWMLKTAFLK